MRENEFGRRQFLRSTATAGIGIAGGIAATGTVAANTDEIRVYSNSNYWEYQIHTQAGYDDLEKGSQANGDDSLLGVGKDSADGQVSQGGTDNYWMDADDTITGINVTYNDYGYINIDVGSSTNYYKTLSLERDENPDWPGYDYTIDINGQLQEHNEYFDSGQDSISYDTNATFSGTLDPGDIDAVLRRKAPTRVFIEDPNSPGLGLIINLPG